MVLTAMKKLKSALMLLCGLFGILSEIVLSRYDRLLLKGKHTKGKDKSALLKKEFKKVSFLSRISLLFAWLSSFFEMKMINSQPSTL